MVLSLNLIKNYYLNEQCDYSVLKRYFYHRNRAMHNWQITTYQIFLFPEQSYEQRVQVQ
jgi:hypothetical protein